MGGGGEALGGDEDDMIGTRPAFDDFLIKEGWSVLVQDNAPASNVQVFAVCLDVAPFRP